MIQISPIGDELQAFLAQILPAHVVVESVAVDRDRRIEIAFIDTKGQHVLVTWTATGWQDLDAPLLGDAGNARRQRRKKS